MWQSDYVIMWGRDGCAPSHSHWLSNPPQSVLGLFPIPSTRLPLQWGWHPQLSPCWIQSWEALPGRRLESEGSQNSVPLLPPSWPVSLTEAVWCGWLQLPWPDSPKFQLLTYPGRWASSPCSSCLGTTEDSSCCCEFLGCLTFPWMASQHFLHFYS